MNETIQGTAVTERVHWRSISAAIASISVVGIAIGLGIPLLSVILEQRGYSPSMIGLNTAIAGIASIAAAPLATPIAMRFGVVWTMLVMILAGAVAFVGFHFAPSFWMWFPLRAILHFALTVLLILSEFWISTCAPPHRRGLVLGVYATVLALGFAAGPWLFAQIGSSGFLPFGLTFCLVMIAAIPVLLARSESPRIVSEGGKLVIRPMRYQCRLAGKPANYDQRYPGTYNARRDSLEKFWAPAFGHTHGLLVVDTFYENVEGPDGKNQVVQFTPRTGEPMLVACLWSHWTDPTGKDPDLLSFAAITDDPEPEVAAAGHDRTIINIKPEHVDAWLNPDPADLAALYRIFDDKRHPFYEHRLAA